jgi:ferritin-like metal-binding protein YciE
LKHISDVEVLALAKLLEMENNSLALAKTSIMAISDEQLKSLAQTGIQTTENRITGLEKFISENILSSSTANQPQMQ